MIKDLQSLSLMDILPDSILADKKVAAAAQALDAELQAVTQAAVETMHIPRIDILPEAVIDLLAWQWHVDFYEPLGMDIDTKRRLIKESIAWHRIKGTPAAIEKVVSAAFDTSKVQEWYEYGGQPYYFKVVTEDVTTDKAILDRMRRAIESVKNTRSWLEKIEFLLHLEDAEKMGEGSSVDVGHNALERYPWLMRCFDGSWNFPRPAPADGGRFLDGHWLFDGIAEGAEDKTRLPRLFMDGFFDGSWNFAMSSDSSKIFFNALEPDHFAVFAPQLSISDKCETVLDFAGAGRLLDGSWLYGQNDLDDASLCADACIIASETSDINEADAMAITAGDRENYPMPRLWCFNGGWKFGRAETFSGTYNFGSERFFDGLPAGTDQVMQPDCLDGKKMFSGSWDFDVPSPAVRFEADEDAADAIETYFSFAPIAEKTAAKENAVESTSLICSERMAKMLFDGAAAFAGGSCFDGDAVENVAWGASAAMQEKLKHGNVFAGSNLFDGRSTFGDDAGPAEGSEIIITEGRWFDGIWDFDGGTIVHYDGNYSFDGAVFHCLLRNTDVHYDGKRFFDGSVRYKRSGETFCQYKYAV